MDYDCFSSIAFIRVSIMDGSEVPKTDILCKVDQGIERNLPRIERLSPSIAKLLNNVVHGNKCLGPSAMPQDPGYTCLCMLNA